MRTVARTEFPSQMQAITFARWSLVSVFMLTIMHERVSFVKRIFAHLNSAGGHGV